jgi:hypothetical protein
MTITATQLSWGIILAGIFYSLYLLRKVPEGVFFTGDGGLKALLAQQLSRGQFRLDLVPAKEAWVRHLWQQGLYPYKPPFVYDTGERYYLSFPFTFSVLTAPFYSLFGYRGLYVIPLLSSWAIWIALYLACQGLNFDSLSTSLALFMVIFASNLTLYSAMYWENTLAVALAFVALAILLIPTDGNGLSIQKAILSGCLVGFSPWVRSEFFALIGTLTIWSVFGWLYEGNFGGWFSFDSADNFLDLSTQNQPIFWLSMMVTLGIFLLLNKIIYGRFLGIHSLLILEDFSWSRRLLEAWSSFKYMVFSFFNYFPPAFISVLYLLIFILQNITNQLGYKITVYTFIFILFLSAIYLIITGGIKELKSAIKQNYLPFLILTIIWLSFLGNLELTLNTQMIAIYLISLLFMIGVSVLVDIAPDEINVGGKQWGPRYFLILVPVISLLAVEQFQSIQEIHSQGREYLSIFTIIFLLILGIYKNIYLGTLDFSKKYQKIAPAIQILREKTDKFVAFSHQHAAQVLEAPLKGEKLIFRVEDSQALLKLGTALVKQGETKFIYVCYPHRKCQVVAGNSSKYPFTLDNQQFEIALIYLGTFGKYPIYQASIIEQV